MYTVKKDFLNKEISDYNFLSKILFRFVIYMTFYRVDSHFTLLNHALEIFTNCEEYIGSYCYRKIGQELRLITILKKFDYFKNMMKKEPCRSYLKMEKQSKRFCIGIGFIKTIKYLGRPINLKFIYMSFLKNF